MTTASTNAQSSLKNLLKQKPWSGLNLIEMEQVHGDKLAVISNPGELPSGKIPLTDGVITNQPGVGLLVRTADCLPILLHHQSGLIGAIHAGRKGTQKGILSKALHRIKNDFGIKDNLTVWFGPAICGSCYQIDRETDQHFDLYKENRKQLEEVFPLGSAVLKEINICTLEHPDYFSYRQTGPGVKMNYFLIAQ